MIARLGIFDSGVGGFTVLKKVIERHGNVSSLYLGDTARVPYGEKKTSEIRLIAQEIVHWFRVQDVSAILVACNTTNSLAFDIVQKMADLPVLGLINSAAEMITERRVGVLATSATVSSSSYKKHIEALRPGTKVFERACPAFVPLIETGQLCINSIQKFALEYLQPLLDARVEVIILGCSHYPLLMPVLQKFVPADIRIIDPAIGLAHQLDSLLGKPQFSFQHPVLFSNTRFCVTFDPIGFASRATTLIGNRPEVELTSLQPKACFS